MAVRAPYAAGHFEGCTGREPRAMQGAALDGMLAAGCLCQRCGQDLSAAGFAQRVAHIKKCALPRILTVFGRIPPLGDGRS